MRLSRSLLGDLGLVALGLGTLALVGLVLTGAGRAETPVPGQPTAAAPRPAVSSPAPTASPTAVVDEQVRVLLLGDEVAAGLGPAAERALGWDVVVDSAPESGYVSGVRTQQYLFRLTRALEKGPYDVVVLVASGSDGEDPDATLLSARMSASAALVREQAPDAELVLVAPPSVEPGAFEEQRSAITQVAARFGGFYVDPVGRRWLVDKPELFAVGRRGLPNAAGYREMATRLRADLRVTFPRDLIRR